MQECLSIISSNSNAELLWASPRELYNIFQANEIGCHIITVGDSILDKVGLIGKNLDSTHLKPWLLSLRMLKPLALSYSY